MALPRTVNCARTSTYLLYLSPDLHHLHYLIHPILGCTGLRGGLVTDLRQDRFLRSDDHSSTAWFIIYLSSLPSVERINFCYSDKGRPPLPPACEDSIDPENCEDRSSLNVAIPLLCLVKTDLCQWRAFLEASMTGSCVSSGRYLVNVVLPSSTAGLVSACTGQCPRSLPAREQLWSVFHVG